MTPEWRVSTLSRQRWIAVGVAAVIGLAIGALAHGGNPERPGGGPATAALFSPLSFACAAGLAAVVGASIYLTRSELDGGGDWIRCTRPKPVVIIRLTEIARVVRMRPVVVGRYGKPDKVASTMGFTLSTSDGRTIAVKDAATYRRPALADFYERAMRVVLERALSSTEPYVAGDVSLFPDRLALKGGATIALADIGKVVIELGTGVEIVIVDRSGLPTATLPDDEVVHRLLARRGVRVEHRDARA